VSEFGPKNSSPQIVERLYEEAVSLADQARAYFGTHAKEDRRQLDPIDRLTYTSESLRISTRLMHVISWLMVRKSVAAGEITEKEALKPKHRLGDRELCKTSNIRDLRRLPPMVSSLSLRSQAIFARAMHMEDHVLQRAEVGEEDLANPVGAMMQRLHASIK
jgi:regulator of CtrA degradation